jgi:hypothetical protein
MPGHKIGFVFLGRISGFLHLYLTDNILCIFQFGFVLHFFSFCARRGTQAKTATAAMKRRQ